VTGAERLLAACRREPVDATPVWFMRQSGGSLPAYLRLRERLFMLLVSPLNFVADPL
jgi:uroporphyrinogen decarboxylase